MRIKLEDIRAFASPLAVQQFGKAFGDEAEVTRKSLLKLCQYTSALVGLHPEFKEYRAEYHAAADAILDRHYADFDDLGARASDERTDKALANALADVMGLD